MSQGGNQAACLCLYPFARLCSWSRKGVSCAVPQGGRWPVRGPLDPAISCREPGRQQRRLSTLPRALLESACQLCGRGLWVRSAQLGGPLRIVQGCMGKANTFQQVLLCQAGPSAHLSLILLAMFPPGSHQPTRSHTCKVCRRWVLGPPLHCECEQAVQ